MATLRLKNLTCQRTQEAKDEPYLTLEIDNQANRVIFGPQSMDDGSTAMLNFNVRFRNRAYLRLMEQDKRRNDTIGGYLIQPDDTRRVHRFHKGLAVYDIHYEVRHGNNARLYRLELVSLRCSDAQEARDETYIMANGRKIWGPATMKTGQSRNINRHIDFNREVNLEIWEADRKKSDWIGSQKILGGARGQRVITFYQTWGSPVSNVVGADASYHLTIRLSRLR